MSLVTEDDTNWAASATAILPSLAPLMARLLLACFALLPYLLAFLPYIFVLSIWLGLPFLALRGKVMLYIRSGKGEWM